MMQQVRNETVGHHGINLMDEAMEVIDPITEVLFMMNILVFGLWRVTRQSVWTMMGAGNMH